MARNCDERLKTRIRAEFQLHGVLEHIHPNSTKDISKKKLFVLCCSDCHVVQHHIIHTCRQQTFWPNQSYCSMKALSNQENNFFFIYWASNNHFLQLPCLRSTQQTAEQNHTQQPPFLVFLFVYLCSECLWPSVFQTQERPTTPSNTNKKSVCVGAENWEPVCSTGDNTLHTPAINQIPSNQRWTAGGSTTTAAD